MGRGFPLMLAFVLSVGIAALDLETDGFRAFTSAGARHLSVERTPETLPDARIIDQNGTPFTLSAYKGRAVLVDFVYTRCPTICGVLGDDLARVQQSVRAGRSGAPVDLLSISFDPADTQEDLRRYGRRYGATAPRWRIAAPAKSGDRAALLRSFGVVVIPDEFGGFIHNDAFYIIDARGRLVRIVDPDTPAPLAAAAIEVAAR
jgi:protein SCO1